MKTSIFTVLLMGIGLASPAQANFLYFNVGLSGDQEVNAIGQFDQGDPDGYGVAKLVIDTATNAIDWQFIVSGIDTPLTGAHIHSGAAGVNGPVVVNFNAQFSGANLVDADLANVAANPSGFYVNLHNSVFPGGAVRGQICDPYRTVVPVPAAVWLFGSGLLGLIGVARRKAGRGA